MGGEDRGRAMAASVVRAAEAHGVPGPGIQVLSRAHALAMAPRVAALEDDRHPDYLHPGRTVLVLLRDAEIVDPVTLAAASLVESEHGRYRVGPTAMTGLPEAVVWLVSSVPPSGCERLAEELVAASRTIRLVAVAERLDQLRHAHRWESVERRRAAHAEAEAVYLPVAHRTHPKLAARLEWWRGNFARRFLS